MTQARMQQLVATFHHEHQRLYTYHLPQAPVELVNLRVTAVGLLPKLKASALTNRSAAKEEAQTGTRRVYFEQTGGFIETPCYARDRLGPGMAFDGPAIIDQDDATTVLFPSFQAQVDLAGNLILTRSTRV